MLWTTPSQRLGAYCACKQVLDLLFRHCYPEWEPSSDRWTYIIHFDRVIEFLTSPKPKSELEPIYIDYESRLLFLASVSLPTLYPDGLPCRQKRYVTTFGGMNEEDTLCVMPMRGLFLNRSKPSFKLVRWIEQAIAHTEGRPCGTLKLSPVPTPSIIHQQRAQAQCVTREGRRKLKAANRFVQRIQGKHPSNIRHGGWGRGR